MTIPLPKISLHESVDRDKIDAAKIVDNWLSALEHAIKTKTEADLSDLFIDDCWWRDIISLSWDWATKHGHDAIFKYVNASSTGFSQLSPVKEGALSPMFVEMGPLQFIQSGFTFQTVAGSGVGLVRLANEGPKKWRAWTVFTQLERLKNQKEILNQPQINNVHNTVRSGTVNGDADPVEDLQVLIVGGGQSGLSLGAHLKNLGLKFLIVDKSARVGDTWRNRYDTVTSHTPKYTDHFPFLKFPDDLPAWLPRDAIADWMETYNETLGLGVMTNTEVISIEYNESTRRYSVEVQTPQGKKTMSPRHVVLASGLLSPVPIRPEFPGEETFKGQIYHSVKHKSARETSNLHEKNVVLIGPGTSAHDIAQDFVNHGAKSVSIVQRHPIFSFTTESCEKVMFSLWNTPGITTEEADVIGCSFPLPVLRTLNVGQTQMMVQLDKDLLDGLEKAGMALKKGEDGVGLIDHQFLKGGHFYLNQGASPMIVDGRIKIYRCEDGVKEFTPDGLVLGNGTKIDADVVVLATGFNRNILTVEQIMGKKVREKVGDLGFIDEDMERIGWWRPTGQPGFWYQTGSFVWSRQFSKFLALQLSAIEEGLNPAYYDEPDTKSRVKIL
ncbi:conserved hypothetical protein [Paecilomyces variotii No. 5]|uniref:Flavin-binding monooxygenase n=1 Tax=Byssochlamys spectabilis (strain No. 5 / NBRC 109023) TaxID=1356009 RepID=V5G288_BYSSN|nr:conserved hypothetical protein [Paecilomyces variotii No. 5]